MESTQPVLRETPSLQKEISQTTHQKKRDMAVTPDSGHVLNSGQALCRQSTVAMRSAFLASMCEYGALPLERLAYRAKKHPGRAYLRQPIAGRMRVYTWGRVYHEARRMAAYLSSLMLPLGSRIALLSKNCAHWIMADYAIWLAGHVSVPLFPSLSKDAIRRILMHAEASVLFAGKLDNWPSQREGIPQGIKIIGLPLLDDPSVDRWDAVIAEQEPIAEPVQHSADTLATIIYTSGTTGDPKGVMHSFGSLASAVGHASDIYRVSSRDRVLSYLPLSHVAERLVVELASLYEGFTVFFVESLETFTEDIQRAQPTLFFAVPRVWSLFRQGVLERIPENLFDAILYIPVCSSALRRMVLKELGLHKTRLFLSGGAPLAESVLQWYAKLGVQILESYGLTENMGYSHCTREHDQWAGYVGLPNPGVMVALSDAGEVLVRSATTMMGYYKAPDETANVLTKEGFLRTGDLGVLDHAGRLRITGRMKELFKTSKGQYVAPALIENRLMANVDVEHVCVVGMGFAQPLALVTLSAQARSMMSLNPPVQCAAFLAFLETVNEELSRHEQLSHLVLLQDNWSVDNSMLTPTLKIKRHVIEDHYKEKIPIWAKERLPIVMASASPTGRGP